MGEACLLVGDIGGTNARFALASSLAVGYSNEIIYKCADFATAEDAIGGYLDGVGACRPDVVCLAAAGPIVEGSVRFTNSDWRLDVAALGESFSSGPVTLLNDFESVASGLPYLQEQECLSLGNHRVPNLQSENCTLGVMGSGTGLGAAGLVRAKGQWIPLRSEAGHVGFAPETPRQVEVKGVLDRKLARVSDERLVSGNGLENIYVALGYIREASVDALSAAEIFRRCRAGSDPVAVEAADMFFEILGQVTGNFVLSIGAFDGIYLVGGVVQKHGDLLVDSRYRQAFEAKGRHRHVMKTVPTLLVRHPQPGLLGASAVARSLCRNQGR